MRTNNRLSLLLSNMMIYGLNQVLVALIPMIMLPIYSRMIPDIRIFGTSSLVTTICTLVSVIAGFGMFDAAVRFAFDKDDQEYKITVCTTATAFMVITSIIAFAMLVFFRRYVALAFFGESKYKMLVIIAAVMVIFSTWNSATLIPVRIDNKRKLAIINSLLKVIVTAIVTTILLLFKKYMIAIPIGTLIGLFCSWLFMFISIKKAYFHPSFIELSLLIKMIKYAAPLMITFISYWVYQSADKIMLLHLSNLTEVGIYAIGVKIGAVAGVLQNAFASGWSYFAFSTINDSDQINLISKIYRIFQLICYVCTYFVLTFIYPLFNIFFVSNDYALGAPICTSLFLAPLQLSLMQILGTQMLIKKDTKTYSGVQLIGVIVNIFFNFMLIPFFGARGAAASTLVGYTVPLIILMVRLTQQKRIILNVKDITCLIGTNGLIFYSTLYVYSYHINIILGLIGLIMMVIMFYKDIIVTISYVRKNLRTITFKN